MCVDTSAAHSTLNLEPLRQEVAKAFHKGSVSSVHQRAYEKDLSLYRKAEDFGEGGGNGMKGGGMGRGRADTPLGKS